MKALLDGHSPEIDRHFNVSGFHQFDAATSFLKLRLGQIEDDPALEEWLVRAIILRDTREVAGHIGFHSAPDPEYLREVGLSGLEMGYSVFEPFRRRGIATEAVAAQMRWAHETHGVTLFVASISPKNMPSLKLVWRMGFELAGSHIDETDGPEDIYSLCYDQARDYSGKNRSDT